MLELTHTELGPVFAALMTNVFGGPGGLACMMLMRSCKTAAGLEEELAKIDAIIQEKASANQKQVWPLIRDIARQRHQLQEIHDNSRTPDSTTEFPRAEGN